MSTDSKVITGIVRDGVVVLQPGSELPEGTEVNILIPEEAMTPELEEELAAWQQAGLDTWTMIEDLEREET